MPIRDVCARARIYAAFILGVVGGAFCLRHRRRNGGFNAMKHDMRDVVPEMSSETSLCLRKRTHAESIECHI